MLVIMIGNYTLKHITAQAVTLEGGYTVETSGKLWELQNVNLFFTNLAAGAQAENKVTNGLVQKMGTLIEVFLGTCHR